MSKTMRITATAAVCLLAFSLSVSAIGFKPEEIYESVFVIYSGNSLGSGYAIGKNCVVTNAHVISRAKDITVKTYSGAIYRAHLLGIDEDEDIAVLAVKGACFPYLSDADCSTVNTGDDIYAIGAPKSMSYTLTKGVISAKERRIGSKVYIQIDAAINEGNSGGPLLDDRGRVVGMNTLKMSGSEGIGLAIPAGRIASFVDSLDIEFDSAGNVAALPEDSEADPALKAPKESEAPEETQPTEESRSPTSVVLSIVAAISVVLNVVLIIMLVFSRQKNLALKYDPKERTDFDIDILE